MTLSLIQILVAASLIALILLQNRSAGLSTLFGGEGGFYQTRRGLERSIFVATIILAAVFVGLSIIKLVF